jgi:hypothetical protein
MDRPRFTVDGFQKGPGGKQYRENWIGKYTVVVPIFLNAPGDIGPLASQYGFQCSSRNMTVETRE